MRLAWPLIGRSEEMRTIDAVILAPDVVGIVVRGPAGVGKSRVAREALSAAASQGCETRWVVGTSSARAIPLGAFTAWAQPGVTDTVQLLRGVIESVTAAPSGATVVVGVDDVHLLDDLSTFVVLQIVQRGLAKLILTVRDGEPIPSAITEIWKVGQFERLKVQPLSIDEATLLLTDTLGGKVDPFVAQRLWTLTRGNVLYLRNIVEQGIADGQLAKQHGYWRWSGDPAVPPSLVELIEARIGALPTSVSDVVDVLAVGEPIEMASLRRIADPAAVEEADRRGLITLDPIVGGVEVRVAHPLYGEVRRGRAPPTTLRRLRGLVVAELAASDDRDDIRVVVRRATLSLDSDLTPDHDLLVRAARGAVWLADLLLADRLAEAAIRAGASQEANFIRAHALSWLGRGEEADAVLAEIRSSDLTGDDHARFAFLRASNMLWVLADPARAKELIDDASRATPRQARFYIDAFLTVYWFAMDEPNAATEAAIDLVLDDLPEVVGAEIAWALAEVTANAGITSEAVAIADAGYTVATREFDAPHMRFNIADAHISALLLAGRVQEALDVAERVREQATNLPGAAQFLGAAIAGRAALGAGRVRTARVMLDRAAEAFSSSGHEIGWGYRYHVPRMIALAIDGSIDEAAAALAVHDKLQRPFRSLDHERSLARAWVAAGEGAVSEAITVLLSASERAAAKGQFAAEVICLQAATQFGDCSGACRLRELEAIVEGPRVGVAARFAQALRDGNAAELASVSEDFEQMGDLVAAIDAAARAALVFRRQGLRGSALGCATRADDLAELCGVITPALRQAVEPLPLTQREQEVVNLIAQGFSNREVAARLSLSLRTVESHIYRAMLKTGTTGRDQLVALLIRRRARTESK